MKNSPPPDIEAAENLLEFEALIDRVTESRAGLSRDILRKSILKAHRNWALKQQSKPTALPPKA